MTYSKSTTLAPPATEVKGDPGPSGPRLPRRTGSLLSRPAARRALAGLAVALVVFGVGMLIYPVTTDVYTRGAQRRLRREFDARVARASSSSAPAGAVAGSDAAAVITIAKLELDAVVVEGTDPLALRAGPGHYEGAPQPCGRGNVAIAGHRTTYGRPFGAIDELVAGDRITLRTPGLSCTYEVMAAPVGARTPSPGSAAWITTPDDWSVVAVLQGSFLTLTTCHPKNSAAERLVVRARLLAAGAGRT